MCKVLGLTTSSYYQWLSRYEERLKKRKKERVLAALIGEIFEANKKVYGYRKMHKALAKQGMRLSEYKVRKIIKESGYYPIVVTKYKPYKNTKSDGKYHDDKVNRDFKAELPNRIWVGDITYIKTSIGFVYLAAVIDLFNREISRLLHKQNE